MEDLFLNYLMYKLEKNIAKEIKENKQVDYLVELKSVESDFGDRKCIFEVIKSLTKGKLNTKLKPEEKLRIVSCEQTYIGTLININANELEVFMLKDVISPRCKLMKYINFNNGILAQELSKYNDGQSIDVFILTSFITCIMNKIEALIDKMTIDNIPEGLTLFYILLLEDINDVSRNDIIDKLFEAPQNMKIKNIIKDESLDKPKELSSYNEIIDKIFDLHEENIPIGIESSIETTLESLSLNPSTSFVFYDSNLNNSQKLAVNEILNKVPYKIIGPPGTGKTSTIVEIISQLLKKNQKILICGPSNTSIDNIISKFVISKWYTMSPTKFYRRGSSLKGLCHLNLESKANVIAKGQLRAKNGRKSERLFRELKKKYMHLIQSETRLVFSTTFSSRKELYDFDWVIIDEACQSSMIESFLAVTHGKKFILVGDPNQLCPDSRSLFESLDLKTHLLDTQYRMCERLISFSNETFYSSKIISHIKRSHEIIKDSPLVFVDTSTAEQCEIKDGGSKMNEYEAEIVVKLVSYINSKDIGIITPYTAQVNLLKKKINNLDIATVDGFQGREKEYIIISLVRSNESGKFGFLDNYRRLNVAITRCKKGLIIVGNSTNFRKSELISKFIKFIENNFISIDPLELDEYFKEEKE